MKALSWKATKRGNRRCAPACGHGCTQEEYERATREAAQLSKVLEQTVGGEWEPRVWENVGWHWAARQGAWKVHPFEYRGKVRSYTALLGPSETGGIWAEGGRTPRSAVRNTRKVAEASVREKAMLLGMALVESGQ